MEAFAEKLGFVPPDDILGKNVITPPEVIVILHAVGCPPLAITSGTMKVRVYNGRKPSGIRLPPVAVSVVSVDLALLPTLTVNGFMYKVTSGPDFATDQKRVPAIVTVAPSPVPLQPN